MAAAALRRVQADCSIEIDTNAYSVPSRLIGETVRMVVVGGRISIQHGGREVAVHPETTGRRQRLVEPAHFAGITPARPGESTPPPPPATPPVADLLRPRQEHDPRVVGSNPAPQPWTMWG